jgi:NAD(P)-dependent dehydrogenase (short-subunit alcohol dehydrogenase family)
MMNINSQLDELFQQWEMHEACAEGIFIPDGQVDEKAWTDSRFKLMVLLKEVNSSDAGWNLQQFIREKGTDGAAKVIVFLASEAASYVTGTTINIDGGSGPSL